MLLRKMGSLHGAGSRFFTWHPDCTDRGQLKTGGVRYVSPKSDHLTLPTPIFCLLREYLSILPCRSRGALFSSTPRFSSAEAYPCKIAIPCPARSCEACHLAIRFLGAPYQSFLLTAGNPPSRSKEKAALTFRVLSSRALDLRLGLPDQA